MVKHKIRSVLVVSMAILFLSACDSGKIEQTITAQPKVDMSMSMSPPLSPSQPAQCNDGASLAAGMNHTVGLKQDGTVVAAGNNGNGQVNVSSWTDIKAVAAGTNHTVGLKQDGTVVAVGYNGNGQANVSSWSGIRAIAAGANHTVGLKEDGTAVAVGNNGNGQLDIASWTGIQAAAAGMNHTVGLKQDGTVVAVGNNGFGQLDVSSWTGIKAVAAGANHTVGLKEDGTVVAVGNNLYGQLDVSSWTGIKAIATSTYHTVGLNEDGTVVAVGNSMYGKLDVTTWTGIKAVAAGTYHTIGLNEDGTVVAVGNNNYGQVGISSWTNIMPVCEPIAVSAKQDVTPPMSTAMVNGTLGTNGWYVSDVQITLTATDNDGGSGVKELHYTVDGMETVVQGNSATNSIVSDGTHTVTFYAIDSTGNLESPLQEMIIHIDKTAPSIPALSTNTAILWPPNRKKVNIVLKGSVSDSVSGIASTVITVTDEYGIYNMTVPGFGTPFQLEAWRKGSDKDGRVYTITAVITDNAGNQTTTTTTVIVPHDMGKGSCKQKEDDDSDHDGDHEDRGHDKRKHKTDNDREGHGKGR